MTAKEEVQIIAGQLEALMKHEPTSASGATIAFLRSLEKIPLNLTILHDTNIGRIVNSIRKDTKNEEVAAVCKGLVRSWKGLLAVTTNGTEEHKNAPATAEPDKKRMKKEEIPSIGIYFCLLCLYYLLLASRALCRPHKLPPMRRVRLVHDQ